MEEVARTLPAEGERGGVEEEALEGKRVGQQERRRVDLGRVHARTAVAPEALQLDGAQLARVALAELVVARHVREQVHALPRARRRAPQLVVQRERRIRAGAHPSGHCARRVRRLVLVHRQRDARRRSRPCEFTVQCTRILIIS